MTAIFNTVKRAISYSPRFWLLSIAGAIITAIPWYLHMLVSGMLMKTATESIFDENISMALVWISVFFCLLRLPTILGYYLNSYGGSKVVGKIVLRMTEKWISRDEEKCKLEQSDVQTRIVSDAANIMNDFYFQGFGLKVVEPILTGVFALITITWIDYRLTFFSVIIAILSYLCIRKSSNKITSIRAAARTAASNATGITTEIIECSEYVRANQQQALYSQKAMGEYRKVADNYKSAEIIEKRNTYISRAFECLAMLCFFVMGYILSQKGEIFFPDIMIALSMQNLVNNFIMKISVALSYLKEVDVYIARIEEVLSIESEPPSNPAEHKNAGNNKSNRLRVEKLEYSYNGFLALRKVDIQFEQGKLYAIVGESGSGKSTLLNLLTGRFHNYSGGIFLDDTDYREAGLDFVRSKIAYVAQDCALFNQTIYDNIMYGNLDGECTEQKIEAAAISANAYDFIMSFPENFQQKINENGKNISGGERQRITIARALYREAPIIILDEPFSALDKKNRAMCIDILHRQKNDKIIIFSSHQLHDLDVADEIICMSDGRVKERGSYHELLEKKGHFYQLHSAEN